MTSVATCLTIAALHLALQAWPRIQNRFFGVDCWRHMLAADFIRRRGRLPVDSLKNYLFRGSFDYPPFVPVVLAFLTPGVRLAAQAVVAPIFECLHGILVFTLVLNATGDSAAALVSQLIFALVPITALENSQLNARSPGSLFLSVCVIGATWGATTGNAAWLISSITAGVLVHLTHKMASQTLVMFSLLGVPLAWWMGGVPLVGIASLGIALLVFPRLMRRILAGHVSVLRYHRTQLAAAGEHGKPVIVSRGFVGRAVALAKSNPAVTIVGAVPWVLFLPFLGSAHPAAGLPTLLGRVMGYWVALCLFLIVTTAVIRPLRFLGDGPRYSFYLACPVAVLSGPLLAWHMRNHDAWSHLVQAAAGIVMVAVLAEVFLMQWKGVVSDTERSCRGDVAAICDRLRVAPEARVAVFPLCTAEVIAFFGDCRVLSTDSAMAHAENADFLAFNPRLSRPLHYFLERYAITHVVLEHQYAGLPDFTLPPDFIRDYHGPTYSLWGRDRLTASGHIERVATPAS